MNWIRIGIKTPQKNQRDDRSQNSRASSKDRYKKFAPINNLKESPSRKSLGVIAPNKNKGEKGQDNISSSRFENTSFLIRSPSKAEITSSPITPIKSASSAKFKDALEELRLKMLRSSIEPELHRLKKLCGQIRNILHMTLLKINEFCKEALIKTADFARRTTYEIENHMKIMTDTGSHLQRIHQQLQPRQPNLKLNLTSLEFTKKASTPVETKQFTKEKQATDRSETQGESRKRANKSTSQCMQITEAIKRMKGILGPSRYDL